MEQFLKENLYSMREIVPVMLEFFAEGKDVVISAAGNSMAPLLHHKRDGIVLREYKGESLKVGDAIFYRRIGGRYVLHRIVGMESDGSLTLMGDNQDCAERGIMPSQIIALPVAFIRGKKTVSVCSAGYRRYAVFWAKSSFFRRLHIKLFNLRIKIARLVKKLCKA